MKPQPDPGQAGTSTVPQSEALRSTPLGTMASDTGVNRNRVKDSWTHGKQSLKSREKCLSKSASKMKISSSTPPELAELSHSKYWSPKTLSTDAQTWKAKMTLVSILAATTSPLVLSQEKHCESRSPKLMVPAKKRYKESRAPMVRSCLRKEAMTSYTCFIGMGRQEFSSLIRGEVYNHRGYHYPLRSTLSLHFGTGSHQRDFDTIGMNYYEERDPIPLRSASKIPMVSRASLLEMAPTFCQKHPTLRMDITPHRGRLVQLWDPEFPGFGWDTV